MSETTIPLTEDTRDELWDLKARSESYDDFIRKLLELHEVKSASH